MMPDSKLSEPITITFSDGIEKAFTSLDAITEFVDGERSFWLPLVDNRNGSVARIINRNLGMVNSALTEFLNSSAQPGAERQLKAKLTTGFGSDSGLLFSGTVDAQSIIGVADSHGVEAGDGAFLFAHKFPANEGQLNLDNKHHLLGVFSFLMSKYIVSASGATAAQAAVTDLVKSGWSEQSAIQKTFEEALDGLLARTDQIEFDLEKSKESVKCELNEFTEKNLEEISKKIKELDETREVYQNHMELRAPSDYWDKKAKSHLWLTRIWGGVSLVFGVLGGGFLVHNLQLLYNDAFELVTQPSAAAAGTSFDIHLLVILAAKGIVISTLFFWAERVFVRLFLSELHLRMDARERVTMVQCYLALTEKRDVESEGLGLVLAALFRPTEDGIVKDDTSSDPAIAAVLNKLGKN